MAIDGVGAGDLEKTLRAFERLGVQVQARPRIRDMEDDFMAMIESIQTNPDYVVKVQQLWDLYGTAIAFVGPEVKAMIAKLMANPAVQMPTFKTEVMKASMEGAMLYVQISRAEDSRSSLPLDSPTHFGMLLEKQYVLAHTEIYRHMIAIKGYVVRDLVEKLIIPRKPKTVPTVVDLELDGTDGTVGAEQGK